MQKFFIIYKIYEVISIKNIFLVLLLFLHQYNVLANLDSVRENPRVLIIGAGISGLTMAIALEKINIIPELIEIKPEISAEGAGIALPPNATWALEKLGIRELLRKNASHIKRITFTDHKAKILASEDITKLHNSDAQFYSIHRADLSALLFKHLKKTKIYLGTTIKRIYQNAATIKVTFSNNETKTYDLVIGADGIHSKVRELLYGPEKLNYQNIMVWRTVVELPKKLVQPIYMMGENTILLLYPINKGRTYVYAQVVDFEKKRILDHKERIGKLFSNYRGYVPLVLKEIESKNTSIIPSRIYTNQVKWGYGNIILIGDAAHAFTPALGQGGAQAIEDAYVLSLELREGLSNHVAIGEILKNFVKRRDARIQTVMQKSSRKVKKLSAEEIQNRNNNIKKNGAPNISAFRDLMKSNP